MTDAFATPPGWYPDGTGAVRWWDGRAWTEHAQQPYSGTVSPKAPDGTKPYTVWIWLIVLLPLVALPLVAWFLVDWVSAAADLFPAYIGDATSIPPPDPDDLVGPMLQVVFSPLYFATIALSWLIQLASILFAWLDWRELGRRGVSQPFHWAWIFLMFAGAGSLVYLIGRTVVVRRRTGGGMAVIWVLVAQGVLGVVLGIVGSAWMISTLTGAFVSRIPFSALGV